VHLTHTSYMAFQITQTDPLNLVSKVHLYVVHRLSFLGMSILAVSVCRLDSRQARQLMASNYATHKINKLCINHPILFLIYCIYYRQSGWLCTRWGEIAQSLNFKYLYKSHCKSNELLWVLCNMVSLRSPQQSV
jgi:hypothetical protein